MFHVAFTRASLVFDVSGVESEGEIARMLRLNGM